MNEEKINDLEIKIAYQEQSIQDLSDVLHTVQNRMDQMQRKIDELLEQAKSDGGDGVEYGPANEAPPHY